MSKKLEKVKVDYALAQEELDEFMDDNAMVIDRFRSLVEIRNGTLSDLTDQARKVALTDDKRRGAVTVAGFTFTKKLRETYDPERLLACAPEIAEHGVFCVTTETVVRDPRVVAECLQQSDSSVKVDKARVQDLVNQGYITAGSVEPALDQAPLTPSLSKGPKAYPVP